MLGVRAHAAEVVLMTSLQAPNSVLNDLETRFHEKFDSSGFQVKVIRAATQKELREELLSNDVAGLFWVSHAASEKSLVPGMDADATILDQSGDNVKNLFSEINPSLQFLAIIGCQAKGIAQEFAEKGYYGLHPKLRILAFDEEVEVHEGLDDALDTSDDYLSSSTAPQPASAGPELSIRITRTASTPLAGVRIDMGEAVVGFLPPANPGETQEMVGVIPEVYLQKDALSGAPDLNLKVSLDRSAGEDQALGTLEFTPDDWKLFSLAGTPVGNESELYLFTGTTASFSSLFNP